jgi:hypothetical protein
MVMLDLPHAIFHYIVVSIARLHLLSGRAEGELVDACVGCPAITNVYLPLKYFPFRVDESDNVVKNESRMRGKGKMKKSRKYLGVS